MCTGAMQYEMPFTITCHLSCADAQGGSDDYDFANKFESDVKNCIRNSCENCDPVVEIRRINPPGSSEHVEVQFNVDGNDLDGEWTEGDTMLALNGCEEDRFGGGHVVRVSSDPLTENTAVRALPGIVLCVSLLMSVLLPLPLE